MIKRISFACACLCLFSGANAVDLPVPYNSVEYKNFSKPFAWTPLNGATPGGGGVQFRQAGATDVTPKPVSLRLTQAAKAVNVAADVKIPLGATGKVIPVLAKTGVTAAMYARGAGAMLGGPLGVSLVLLPLLVQWVDSLGDHRIDPATGEIERLNTGTEFDTFCELSSTERANWMAWSQGRTVTTTDWINISTPYSGISSNGQCAWGDTRTSVRTSGGTPSTGTPDFFIVKNKLTVPRNTATWGPSNWNDVATAFDRPNAPDLTPEVLIEGVRSGVDPFIATPTTYTTSGPSSIPSPGTTTTEQTRVDSGTTREASPNSTTATDPATKTTTTTSSNTVNYNGDKVTYTTTTNTVTNITNNTTGVTEKIGDKQTVKEGDDPEEKKDEEPATDTPLGELPKLYERKYPDGLVGIWEDKSEQIKEASLFKLADDLMPKSISGGSCPYWMVSLEFGTWASYGTHNVAPPCWIWDVAKAVVLIGALMLARGLIFGG